MGGRAAIDGFAEFGVRRLAIVNPYPDDLNGKLTRFLEGYGFSVVSLVSRRR
jgi:maleate cis-trans isomerase